MSLTIRKTIAPSDLLKCASSRVKLSGWSTECGIVELVIDAANSADLTYVVALIEAACKDLKKLIP